MHNEPHDFATAASALLSSEALWTEQSEAALRYARTSLNEEELQRRLRELLRTLTAQKCARPEWNAQLACNWTAAGDEGREQEAVD